MKRTGNAMSNKMLNLRNAQPNLPLDADEVDMAMEKFIRDKYQRQSLVGQKSSIPAVRALGQHDTGSTSTSSNEDKPPPVPAKNAPRFGAVRAASSVYPEPRIGNDIPMPPPKGRHNLASNRALTSAPSVPTSGATYDRPGAGVTNPGTARLDATPSGAFYVESSVSSSPMTAAAQSQPSVWDPYAIYAAPATAAGLDSSMQSLHLSQQHALFPNNTGTISPQIQQHNPFLRTFTPPVPRNMYDFDTSLQQNGAHDGAAMPQTNPFLRQNQPQAASLAPWQPTGPAPFDSAPLYTASAISHGVDPQRGLPHPPYPAQPGVAPFVHQPQTSPPLVHSQPSYSTQASQDNSFPHQYPQQIPNYATDHNPYYAPPYYAPPPQPPVHRHDKSSILALYATAQPAQAPPQQQQGGIGIGIGQVRDPLRSASSPLPGAPSPAPGHNNPFAGLAGGPPRQHVRPESRDFAGGAGASGTHSPDAFSGLSARQ